MTTNDFAPVPPAASGTLRGAALYALRLMTIVFGTMVLIGVAIGWWVAESAGVWGALLGIGIAVFFSVATVISMLVTAKKSPTAMAGIVMGVWLGKMLVLFGVLLALRGLDFYSRPVLAVVLCVAVVAAAIIDAVAINRARIPLDVS